jgi:hypothetical protein
MEIAATALRDISSVLGSDLTRPPASEQDHLPKYQACVYATSTLPEMNRIAFGARRTRELIRNIFERFGFSVEFWRGDLKERGLPGAFRSWIIANFDEKHFDIIYDGVRIEEAAKSLFEKEKLLEKILLHECAHGVLHREVIRSMLNQNPSINPRLEPRHEQEAWLYAILVWAVFAGDHARWTREKIGTDMGWMLA